MNALRVEEREPANGSVSLRWRTSKNPFQTDIHLSEEPVNKGRADRGPKENLITKV